ncbi:MAG: DUF4136 domain-containing protein [Burkholderiales bacterium]|nr:DUF4136 domain-containing protein [Burkholderiales bacterium]
MFDCKRCGGAAHVGAGGHAARRWAAALVAVGALLLAGCATPMRGQVTAFNEWPAQAPLTYRFTFTDEQRDSLEQAAWAKVLREELARAGFRESDTPRFAVRFDYRVERHISRYLEAYPMIQPYWWGAWGGPVGGVGFGGPWPWWGPAYPPIERERTWYEYRLHLQFDDLTVRPPRRVYEGTVVSDGMDPAPAHALPLLARGILTGFPGPSGVTRDVEMPAKPKPAAGSSETASAR